MGPVEVALILFGVFALLALSITALLTYSIISVAVEERIREYAILRTLGGKRRDIIRLVLGESLLLCLAGVVPGVLAGVMMAKVGVKMVERIMKAEGNAIALQVSPTTLWLALAAGVAQFMQVILFDVQPRDPGIFAAVVIVLAAAGMAASLVPAKRATRVDPLVALRAD